MQGEKESLASESSDVSAAPHSDWRSHLSLAFALACATAALAFALYRCRYNLFESIDEGFYLAAPMRLSLGDTPFRDEFSNPGRMFDLVLLPIFIAFPDISVLKLRFLLVLFQLAALFPLFRLFSRWVPAGLVALVCASTIWIPNIVWTPGYHVLGGSFFALAWGLWLEGCLSRGQRRASGMGALSGVAFFLCAMCYLPLVVVEIVPALILVAAWWRKQSADHRIAATVSHFASLGMLSLALLGTFAWLGLLGDWLDAFRTISSIGPYQSSLLKMLGTYFAQLARYLPVLAGGFCLGVALPFGSRAWARWSWRGAGAAWIGTLLLAGASFFAARWLFFGFAIPPEIAFVNEGYTRPVRVVVLFWGIYLGVVVSGRGGRADEPGKATGAFSFAVGATFSGVSLAAVVFGMIAGMSFKSFFAAPPLAVCVAASLYRALRPLRNQAGGRPFAAPIVAALCIAIALTTYVSRRPAGPRFDLLVPFTHPRFEGILEHTVKVREWEELVDHLAERVEEGQFLLAYDNIPLLYFATRTRPAIDHIWTSSGIPGQILLRSLQRMIERDRVPRYAVRQIAISPGSGPNPIHRFVQSRYTLETRFRRFEVWQLRDPE